MIGRHCWALRHHGEVLGERASWRLQPGCALVVAERNARSDFNAKAQRRKGAKGRADDGE